MQEPLLEVSDLRTVFQSGGKSLPAVDGVSFGISSGESLALVGESGSGKTVLALSLMGLIEPPGLVEEGRVVFEGRDLRSLTLAELRKVRGARISMIFQEPMTSLNPVLKIGEQIAEALRLHKGLSTAQALEEAAGLLAKVGFSDPKSRLASYPHELSGGMRQRVMVAMALSCSPRLLIADEPTTALDVTIQKQMLELMQGLCEDFGASLLLITHNLGVVAETCGRVAVMYCGRLVEEADTESLFAEPAHPYTVGLMASLPAPGKGRLNPIPGVVPGLADLPRGCHFHPRCERVMPRCREEAPPLFAIKPGQKARCWLYA